MAEHFDFFDLTMAEPGGEELAMLVLTQPADPAAQETYINALVQCLNDNRAAGLPTILIDAGNGTYGTAFHKALTDQAELGWLLSYAGFLDMAIVTGTALSHGVARYAHLVQGQTSRSEETAFCKTLADSILKDFCYKNVVREDILSYVRNDLGGDANNFCLPELDRPAIVARLTAGMDKATAPVLKNLERSSLLIGLKPHVDTVTAHWGKVCLSNYRFPWNRAFEIDISTWFAFKFLHSQFSFSIFIYFCYQIFHRIFRCFVFILLLCFVCLYYTSNPRTLRRWNTTPCAESCRPPSSAFV